MIKQTQVTFIFIAFLTSCYPHSKKYSNNEKKKIESCRNNWVYQDLTQKMDLKVLLYLEKFHYDVSSFPNFIIGVTMNSDTVGIIDKDFDGIINKNEKITVSPQVWTDTDKEILKPVFWVNKKSKINDLQCSVKRVYYGRIHKK